MVNATGQGGLETHVGHRLIISDECSWCGSTPGLSAHPVAGAAEISVPLG
jgi:hypothetical protein